MYFEASPLALSSSVRLCFPSLPRCLHRSIPEVFKLFALLTTAFASPPPLTWSGIDYSMVTMVGTEDFSDPNTIFPGYLNKWNDLFIVEYTGILGRRTGTRITPSIAHLKALHEQADASTQIVRDNTISTEAQLSREEVISHVADAYSPSDGGTAITLIADQLNKPKRTGCYWVTYYDTATLEVHDTTYTCGRAGGIGFRNYWFGSVKFVVDRLRASDVPDSVTTLKLTEEQRAAAEAAQAEKEAKRNWITIRVAPEGLATLSTAGIGYDVVAAGPPPAAPPRVNVVIGGQRGAPTSYGNRRDWPEAECRTAFGKTACGYHCEVGFGDVKCAGSPNGACKIAYGKITCSQ